MTAVVGILNKHAVALAADSAVTIGGGSGRKIFNKANKVFALSKQHPVGIMIYNSASFMATPWEIIIKVYRKQLNSKSFPTLAEYQNDFIEFLRAKNFYADDKIQIHFLENFIRGVIQSIFVDINGSKNFKGSPTKEYKIDFLKNFEKRVDEIFSFWDSQTNYCNDFKDYKLETFLNYSLKTFEKINDHFFKQSDLTISSELELKVKKLMFSILRAKEDRSDYTGLIFTGFGEEEIYPQLIPINISFVVDNKIRYFIDERRIASISNNNSGAVCPFAQIDVIDTILSGIDPSLDNIYKNNFVSLFKKYNLAILESIGSSNPLLSEQIRNLDTDAISVEFNQLNLQIKREKYIGPLMSAVSNLAKEDLAEMAESLIYLTYLKRRITFAEESVGGPVDVAIISKGDGFVWIKRKHYFRPELNQHFFENYFKL
ncbi:MAG: hypothetical protein IPN99_00415 [Bacteroidetes bacterium]|nr:hypothetical protein [Bacteroidota bacterium]